VTIPVGPGQLYLIDTSAHARSDRPLVRSVIAGLITERRRSLYVTLPISEAIAERARDVQLRMAARGHHRAAGVVDLLTATRCSQYRSFSGTALPPGLVHSPTQHGSAPGVNS
jgi:hypothetical protein